MAFRDIHSAKSGTTVKRPCIRYVHFREAVSCHAAPQPRYVTSRSLMARPSLKIVSSPFVLLAQPEHFRAFWAERPLKAARKQLGDMAFFRIGRSGCKRRQWLAAQSHTAAPLVVSTYRTPGSCATSGAEGHATVAGTTSYPCWLAGSQSRQTVRGVIYSGCAGSAACRPNKTPPGAR